MKVHKNIVGSIIVSLNKEVWNHQDFVELALWPPYAINQAQTALVREVTKNPMTTNTFDSFCKDWLNPLGQLNRAFMVK